MIEGIPLPLTGDPLDEPFWQAALRGELVVQQCGGCSRMRFPPRPMCPHCRSTERGWKAVSGRGKVWSFVVPHPPLLPSFTPIAPYNVIVVELDEDPSLRMVGNIVACEGAGINSVDAAAIEIGAAVRVVFDKIADDVVLPRWTPDGRRG
jgi:hypothetical protein